MPQKKSSKARPQPNGGNLSQAGVRRTGSDKRAAGITPGREGYGITPSTYRMGTTGRYLVLFRDGATQAGAKMLSRSAGLKVRSATSGGGVVDREGLGEGAVVFDKIGVAVVSSEPTRMRSLSAESGDPILAIEPERYVYATTSLTYAGVGVAEPVQTAEYLRGYRDAVNQLTDNLMTSNGHAPELDRQLITADARRATWGLYATKVLNSNYTGRGVRLAVLDTGFDLDHPDFAGRIIVSESFIDGEEVQDGNGHGTHCIGTACGPRAPEILPRYGIAYEAEIYAGKVLGNNGSGDDTGILGGIEWAITNQCAIISMSLGAPTSVGETFSQVYEVAAQRALAAGTLIIAAAGNDSSRPELISPVSHPANCPSIMAIAALDRKGAIAYFSCGGVSGDGGQVDIAGPGVAVHSSWPIPRRYNNISGTSMATPHVAGIAALFAEAKGARGSQLWSLLTQNARRSNLPARDVGAGLVQAP